ncbi:MAG: hypothetical protein U0235_32365 [Polyangiaceae bacterium]
MNRGSPPLAGTGSGSLSNASQEAILIFVLGLAGITVFHIAAPVAWIMGNSYVRRCEASGMAPESIASAGRIMGMIGTGLLVLGVLIFTGILVFGVATFGFMMRG